MKKKEETRQKLNTYYDKVNTVLNAMKEKENLNKKENKETVQYQIIGKRESNIENNNNINANNNISLTKVKPLVKKLHNLDK